LKTPIAISEAFAKGWHINYIRATRFVINETPVHKSKAWLASIGRD